jgi:hydroxymethylbilane synthase
MAQWLHRYPGHTIESLRGNIQTRLQKLRDNDWQGAIFAAAGLERLGLDIPHRIELDWMLPAPAQGAVMVVCREKDEHIKTVCATLNDEVTALCVQIERDFLSALMGGCSAPISALATMEKERVRFKGNVLSPDGKDCIAFEETFERTAAEQIGVRAAAIVIRQGARHIIPKLQQKD